MTQCVFDPCSWPGGHFTVEGENRGKVTSYGLLQCSRGESLQSISENRTKASSYEFTRRQILA